MQPEAAQELVEFKRHQPLLVAVGRIAPAKRDLTLFERDQTLVLQQTFWQKVDAHGIRSCFSSGVADRRPGYACDSAACAATISSS